MCRDHPNFRRHPPCLAEAHPDLVGTVPDLVEIVPRFGATWTRSGRTVPSRDRPIDRPVDRPTARLHPTLRPTTRTTGRSTDRPTARGRQSDRARSSRPPIARPLVRLLVRPLDRPFRAPSRTHFGSSLAALAASARSVGSALAVGAGDGPAARLGGKALAAGRRRRCRRAASALLPGGVGVAALQPATRQRAFAGGLAHRTSGGPVVGKLSSGSESLGSASGCRDQW